MIDADECSSSEVLSRVVVACYVLGRDHLVVKSKGRLSAENVDAVRRTSKKLIGVGILEESPEQIVLQCSIDTGRYPVDALFKRLYNLAASAITDSVEALRMRDAKLAHVAASREEDADMIFWLIMRLILSAQQDESVRTLIGLKSRADIAAYAIIAADLERIADQTRVFASNAVWLIQSEIKIPAPVQNAMRQQALEVGEVFANAMRALLSRELDKAVEATELSAKLWKGEETIMLSAVQALSNPEALLRVRRLMQALVLIEESCRQIAIVAFSRHQSEPTRFARPHEDKKGAAARSA
jgi:phosphate uptake regulator